MAKVTLPLMSLAAEGSVGGALVFGRLKGQNVVRILVTPANPQTVAQTAQRTKLTGAVSEWHTAGLTAADIEAYNRWASASFRKMSGYNLFTSQRIKYKQQGGAEIPMFAAAVSVIQTADFTLDLDAISGGVCKVYLGTTKTSQPTVYTMTDSTGDKFTDLIDSLAASTTYYWYIEYTDAATFGYRSGLYTTTTIA